MWKWIITCFCLASGWVFLGSRESGMLEMSQNMASLTDAGYDDMRTRHLPLSLLQISLPVFMLAISVLKPWKKRCRAGKWQCS